MILTLTLNPAIDLVLGTERFEFGDRAFVTAEAETAGGKGINAARVIRAYGGEVLALAPIGGRRGCRFQALLGADGLPAELVKVQGETRRNVAVTDAAGVTLKLDQRGRPLSDSELRRIEAAVERQLPSLDWLMLTGSLPPGTPSDTYRRLASRARRAGARVLVDTSGPALAEALEAGPDVVKPNRSEAAALLGRELPTVDDAALAAREIRAMGATRVVLSLGEQGAVAATRLGALLATPPLAGTGCPVGAGDVLAAACVWAMDRGEPFEEAFRWGVAAATVAASRPGLEFGTPAEADALRRRIEVRSC